MKQPVKTTIQAYEFRADFAPDLEPAGAAQTLPEQVNMSACELAALLSAARAEGIAEVLAQRQTDDCERLEGVTAQLNGALASLVELAGHLDAASTDAALAEKSLALVNAAAKQIIDGQGDLFAELPSSYEAQNDVGTKR